MPVPFRLDCVIHRLTPPRGRAESAVLRELTGLQLPPEQAYALWPAVIEHKWLLSERLGRDVGLRVAAVDYFDNVGRLVAV
jgi:Domain of unknown function (DUF4032)